LYQTDHAAQIAAAILNPKFYIRNRFSHRFWGYAFP
jgi:hypothetical protein